MDLNETQLKERALSYLTSDEVYSIGSMLGREPNPFELNMFAAMAIDHAYFCCAHPFRGIDNVRQQWLASQGL